MRLCSPCDGERARRPSALGLVPPEGRRTSGNIRPLLGITVQLAPTEVTHRSLHPPEAPFALAFNSRAVSTCTAYIREASTISS